MPCANLITDGYVRPGYVRPASGLHYALRFRFRPVLSAERSALVSTAQESTASEFDRQARGLLAEKLVAWNLVDLQGNAVEIGQEAVDRLQPELFLKLYRIVFGYAPSDTDPQWPAEQQNELTADARSAAEIGKTLGEIQEERDEKN